MIHRESGDWRTGMGGAQLFITEALSTETDDCIGWPFAKTGKGYPLLGRSSLTGGRRIDAHRLVCESAHGSAPFKGAQTAHSCGNRACVNKRHLRWATQRENEFDKRKHGTAGHVLTMGDARAIRTVASMGDGISRKRIGLMFGVSESLVGHILAGRTWPELAIQPT